MKHVIIGTAGHVDHGKTALIRTLTGIDTDRLKEEKERGISIDLGFARMMLAPDLEAGIVDVPGHERFLKNMLAGTGGLDMALLVVAADEGVMPQSREHFEMLKFLGIQKGIVAITKIDKVEADWLAMVEEEVREWVKHSFLEQAPICRVSSTTGEGVIELKTVLADIAAQIHGRSAAAPFRMWIDRSFHSKGYGLVATGSVLTGTAKVGDIFHLQPSGQEVRVRGMEHHGQKEEWAGPGERLALNITGFEDVKATRGMALTGSGAGETADRWLVKADTYQPVRSGIRIRVHLGTGEFFGRLYAIRGANPGYLRLTLEAPIFAAAGDRAVIRRYSPTDLLGGVLFLAATGKSVNWNSEYTRLSDGLVAGDPATVLSATLALEENPQRWDLLRRKAGFFDTDQLMELRDQKLAVGSIRDFGGYLITKEAMKEMAERLYELIGNFHQEFPERLGPSRDILSQRIGLEVKALGLLLDNLIEKGELIGRDGEIALPAHVLKLGEQKNSVTDVLEQAFGKAPFFLVTPEWLAGTGRIAGFQLARVMERLVRDGDLIRINDSYVYRKTFQYIVSLIQEYFSQHATITVAQFRDLLGVTRKTAVPMMEYLDINKYTIRAGDERYPGPRLKNLSD